MSHKSYLAKALALWGRTQREFSAVTGIDHATTTRLFQGKRGFTKNQRDAIWRAFVERDRDQALRLLIADLRDIVPAEALENLDLRIRETSLPFGEEGGREVSAADRAAEALIRELQERDPDAVNMALGIQEYAERSKQKPAP